MNKSVFVGLAAAVALCGCSRNAGNKEATTSNASDAGGTPVTLVGCLAPGGAGSPSDAVGTSGNTTPAAFTLIDVTTTSTPSSDVGTAPGASGASGTSGTSATSGTAGSSGAANVDTGTPRSYDLIGDRKQNDLQKYQNSKVEVTGTLIASTDTGAGVPDVGAASAPAGTPATAVQRVRVTKVRQLDKTCSGPNR